MQTMIIYWGIHKMPKSIGYANIVVPVGVPLLYTVNTSAKFQGHCAVVKIT